MMFLNRIRLLRIAVAAALALAAGLSTPGMAAAQATPARYKYTTVALPGEANTSVHGISDSGAYTGEGCNAACTKIVLFVSTAAGHKTFYTLPFSNYDPTSFAGPVGMDNAGDVVGNYLDAKGDSHGYLRRASGAMAQINDPLAAEIKDGGTNIENISANGSVVVGYYYDRSLTLHGFMLRGGRFTTYNVPGAAETAVTFYYDGEFGGSYVSSTGAYYGFYVLHGRLHTVNGPGLAHPSPGEGAALLAESSDGTLFGEEYTQKPEIGFAYAHGTYTTFRNPNEIGTTSLDGTAIYNGNLNGAVVGAYSYTPGTATTPGHTEGFIARPAVTPARAPAGRH